MLAAFEVMISIRKNLWLNDWHNSMLGIVEKKIIIKKKKSL